ncbi:uncharacterized protein LOC8274329 [Ricinus communis]|uniref:uncharacterized protein LOC8274329 n=1 Tax=Ricinus communis TaxID=3988 RepID=UPI00201A7FC3|nr:uncharacterized protein LOC8274329 [Ricinus communis]
MSIFRRNHHQRAHNRNYCENPAPKWEKDFCFEVGGMKWKDFLKRKAYTSYYPKVLQWDNSAGKESFINAKNRFYAEINKSPCKTELLPNPDMYVDEIDWDAKLDPQLFLGLEDARNYKPCEEVVPLDGIKPTGWDVDSCDWNKPVVLTGMIVGHKGNDNEENGKNGGVLRKRMSGHCSRYVSKPTNVSYAV